MIFRQLFDRESCTYTYVLGDETTREAILIDPVRELVDRDMQVLEELEIIMPKASDSESDAASDPDSGENISENEGQPGGGTSDNAPRGTKKRTAKGKK